MHNAFVAFAKCGRQRGIAVGRYVIMPIIFIYSSAAGAESFVAMGAASKALFYLWQYPVRTSIGKMASSIIPLRNDESYAQKWNTLGEIVLIDRS